MNLRSDLPVHLWIYNHPFYGVSDQVEFFVLAMKQHGYPVSVGRGPRVDALNVIIENLSDETSDVLVDFCRQSGKRVAVIMTEHVDLVVDQFYFHGKLLGTDSDYMSPTTQRSRMRNLMECSRLIRCFLVLGDVPQLRNVAAMFPGIPIRALPFPRLESGLSGVPAQNDSVSCDVVFTGCCTKHRLELLERLQNEVSLVCPRRWVSRRVRDAFNRSARIVLNLPQNEKWKWVSLMRIIGALRSGRATVSLGTSDATEISACCTQLNVGKPNWVDSLRQHVADWQEQYRLALERYTAMAAAFEQERPFPHDMFECWQITETTWSRHRAA